MLVFPVVHVNDERQAREQCDLALGAAADGVYLISHGALDAIELSAVVRAVQRDHPESFVGMNLLDRQSGLSAMTTISRSLADGVLDRPPNGLWVDDASYEMESVPALRVENPQLATIRYLGGAAFKYTSTFTNDPEAAAAEAIRIAPWVDVVTTSGPGTGFAAPRAKVAAMKAVLGSQPLALASGVDAANVTQFVGLADEILVSSSIETAHYSGVFDPAKLSELVSVVRSVR